MSYSFPTLVANVDPAQATQMNAVQDAIMEMTAGIYNVLAHGAIGDGVTDDTAAVTTARDAAAAANGTLLFPGNHTYAINQLAGWADGVVIAHGATILHNGSSNALLTIGNPSGQASLQRFQVYGGIWQAKQSATTPTSAVVYMSNAWHCVLADMTIVGGVDAPSGIANLTRYATHGLQLFGRQGVAVQWNNFSHLHIFGAAGYGLHIDGLDPLNLEFCNSNTFAGCWVERNTNGIYMQGADNNIFLGGRSQSNAFLGLEIVAYVKDTQFQGTWLEFNNGDTPGVAPYGDQFTVPTLAAQPESWQRNYGWFGTVGKTGGQFDLQSVNFWKVYTPTSTWFQTVPTTMRSILRVDRDTTGKSALEVGVETESWARARISSTGALEFRDPASDTNSYFSAFSAASVDQFITGATVIFRPRGGVRIGEGTTIKKAQKISAALNFPSILAHDTADLTVAVTGATVGDAITVNPRTSLEAGLMVMGFVSDPDVVTVRLANVTAGAIDPVSRTFDVTWLDMT